jgi:hypothetical protein
MVRSRIGYGGGRRIAALLFAITSLCLFGVLYLRAPEARAQQGQNAAASDSPKALCRRPGTDRAGDKRAAGNGAGDPGRGGKAGRRQARRPAGGRGRPGTRAAEAENNWIATKGFYERAWAICGKVGSRIAGGGPQPQQPGQRRPDQGDLAGAKAFHLRSLTIREKLAPDSIDVAASLNNLGLVAWSQGDLAGAKTLYQRALTIYEKLAPESLLVALSLPVWETSCPTVTVNLPKPRPVSTPLTIRENWPPLRSTVGQPQRPGHSRLQPWRPCGAKQPVPRSLTIKEKLAPSHLCACDLNNLGAPRLTARATLPKQRRCINAPELLRPTGSQSLDWRSVSTNLGVRRPPHEPGRLAPGPKRCPAFPEIQQDWPPESWRRPAPPQPGNVALKPGRPLYGAKAFHLRSLPIRGKLAPDPWDGPGQPQTLDRPPHPGTLRAKSRINVP